MKLTPVQQLARDLVAIKSVTPNDNGCQDLLAAILQKEGFTGR